MKLFSFITLLVLFAGCTQKPKESTPFIPVEYELPVERVREGITTISVNTETGDTSITDFWTIKKNGQEFIISIDYSEGKKKDSTVSGVGFDFYELYTWVGNDSLDTTPKKFIEEEHKRIDDGTKLGKEFNKRRVEYEGFKLLVEGTSSYVRDTSMMIGDSMVNCLVTKLEATIRYESIFPIDSLNRPRPYHSTIYYGKGLGVVRTIGSYDEASAFRWDLKEIRPLQR
jgi:hypothetical protein